MRQNAGPDGSLGRFASSAATEDGAGLPESLRNDLRAGADQAATAYAQSAEFLMTELLPVAPERDAVSSTAISAAPGQAPRTRSGKRLGWRFATRCAAARAAPSTCASSTPRAADRVGGIDVLRRAVLEVNGSGGPSS